MNVLTFVPRRGRSVIDPAVAFGYSETFAMELTGLIYATVTL